ncbi:hypothetical protein TEA_012754 [Camellia sinensis var. sinensis]|uniref:Cupin type-1 domain-containing protein n=1 Tax=Camellia sinensis var. sinensis TaxID=542762 RepID=A0A4S4DY72_CAMSN|nr:hypothetical protein TEA_012754 [Camellia sinensis var. sinensis]
MNLLSLTYSLCHTLAYTCVERAASVAAAVALAAVLHLETAFFVDGKFCNDPKLAKSLNTLGISLACIDFAPFGLNPPHTHLRETEILVILEGTSTLGKTNAVAISGLSSQNPSVITIANVVLGSNPKTSDDVVAKAIQVDKKVVDYLQALFLVAQQLKKWSSSYACKEIYYTSSSIVEAPSIVKASSIGSCSYRSANKKEEFVVVGENKSPYQVAFDRKASRSRSIGCRNMSFSEDFFE